MKTIYVRCTDEMLDQFVESFKKSDPIESPTAFGMYLAFSELRRLRDTGYTPEEIAVVMALAEKMNVCDLVRENLRIANRLRHTEVEIAALKAEYRVGVNAGADAIRQLKSENERLRAERDAAKGALERAARAFESATGIFSFACFCCAYKDRDDIHKCELLGDEVCEDLENWEFDQARFSESGCCMSGADMGRDEQA